MVLYKKGEKGKNINVMQYVHMSFSEITVAMNNKQNKNHSYTENEIRRIYYSGMKKIERFLNKNKHIAESMLSSFCDIREKL